MVKRSRCPYCDRFFNRDLLDDHIQKCRTKKRRTNGQIMKRRTKIVIVDGNNIAYHLTPNGEPLVKNLILAHSSLIQAGYRPVYVISSALFHAIKNIEALNTFMSTTEVIIAPRGMNDDLKIIQTAQERNADIISNDRFLDWIDRYPWIPDRLQRYRMTPTGLILS